MVRLTESLMNLTLPSPMQQLTPPAWKLSALLSTARDDALRPQCVHVSLNTLGSTTVLNIDMAMLPCDQFWPRWVSMKPVPVEFQAAEHMLMTASVTAGLVWQSKSIEPKGICTAWSPKSRWRGRSFWVPTAA